MPILLFGIFFSRNTRRDVWVIAIYCIVSFITDFLIIRFPGDSQVTILIAFTVLEFLFFSTFIFLNLKSPVLKRLILFTSAAFVVLPVAFYLSRGNLNFQSLIFSIENIIIIPFCVLYFYEQINKPDTFFIYLSKSFWIILGIIIYVTGTLFVFIYIDSLPEDQQEKYWIINLIFNTIKNILFAIGIYIKKPKEEFNPYLGRDPSI